MSASTELLDRFAPEFIELDETVKAFWIELAVSWHTASAWSSGTYLSAMVNAAAHLMTQAGLASATPEAASAQAANAAGQVSSLKEGDLAVSYDASNSAAAKALTLEEATWASTKYGRTYLALRARQTGATLLKPA